MTVQKPRGHTPHTAVTPMIDDHRVPRDGIEPPTRGFSGPRLIPSDPDPLDELARTGRASTADWCVRLPRWVRDRVAEIARAERRTIRTVFEERIALVFGDAASMQHDAASMQHDAASMQHDAASMQQTLGIRLAELQAAIGEQKNLIADLTRILAFQNNALDTPPTVTPSISPQSCSELAPSPGKDEPASPALLSESSSQADDGSEPLGSGVSHEHGVQGPRAECETGEGGQWGGLQEDPPAEGRRECAALSTELPVNCTLFDGPPESGPRVTQAIPEGPGEAETEPAPAVSECGLDEIDPEVTKRAQISANSYKYAKAWADGVREATGRPSTIPSGSHSEAINRVLLAHYPRSLRGEPLLAEIRRSAAEFAGSSGYPTITPRGWETWQNNGRRRWRAEARDLQQAWDDVPIRTDNVITKDNWREQLERMRREGMIP